MKDDVFLSVIIPAYNEEKRIRRTLVDINLYLSDKSYKYEVTVVDDGSRDNTADMVRELQTSMRNLYFLSNPQNRGKGYVVRQGMLRSKGTYRLFMDADNSTTLDHFEKVLPCFERGFEVVIGSRDVEGAIIPEPQPFYRRLLGNIGNVIVQAVTVWGIWDTQCGFKAFTSEAAEEIFSRLTIHRWGFDVEVLVIARHLGYRVKEIPVTWVNDPRTHVTWKSYVQMLYEVLKIRWNLLRHRYDVDRLEHGEGNKNKEFHSDDATQKTLKNIREE